MRYTTCRFFLAVAVLAVSTNLAMPASVTPGNILAGFSNRIYEVTTAGAIVQTFQVPGIFQYSGRTMGDLVYDPAGSLHVRINSASTDVCCSSLISSFDLASETWTSTPVNNYNSGGLELEFAQLGNKLFTESNQFDLSTRISVNVSPNMHFSHPDARAENLTLGSDGYFYATWNFTRADTLYRIDPVTFQQIGNGLSTRSPTESGPHVTGLAVKPNGDYYVVSFQSAVYAFKQDQTFISKTVIPNLDNGAGDLSLRKDGFLAFGQSSVGQSSGMLNILNPQLQLVAQVYLSSFSEKSSVYTTFIEVPEPNCAAILWTALVSQLCRRLSTTTSRSSEIRFRRMGLLRSKKV
jgi:hypothetical protein